MYTLKLNNDRWEIFAPGQEQYTPVLSFKGSRKLAENVLAALNAGANIPIKLLQQIAREGK